MAHFKTIPSYSEGLHKFYNICSLYYVFFFSLFVPILQFSPSFTDVYIFTILLSNIPSASHSTHFNSYLCYPCAFISCTGTTLALERALT